MRIRTRSFIIMLSEGLTRMTSILLAVILVRMISQQSFGTYQQVNLVYIFLASVISLQLNSSLYYFIPKLGTELRRILLAQTFVVTFATSAVIGCVMFFGAGFIARIFNNPDLVPLIRIFALYPFVERLIILIPAFMISLDRALLAGIYTVASSVGRVAVVVTMFALGFNLTAIMWSIVVVGGVIAAVGCADMARLSPGGRWRIDVCLLKEQFNYSWPLLATAIVGTINLQLDKLLISSFFTSEMYAVYSCGAVQLPVVAILTASVSSAMMPNLVTMAKSGKIQEMLHTWQEAARKCSLIIFPCFAFFLIIGYDLMVLLYRQPYSLASWPFRIYLFSLLIRVAVYATIFRAIGQTKPIAIAAVFALTVNAVLSTMLVVLGRGTIISFIGPSLGTVLASSGSFPYLLWKLTKLTNTPFSRIMRWKELGQMLLISFACGLIMFLIPLPAMPLIIKLLVQGVIYFVVFLVVMLTTKMLKEDERQMLFLPWNFVKEKFL